MVELQEVMDELKALGRPQTKKTYLNHGAREPLFGVTTGALKPLAKKLGRDYVLSMALYATGNYDAAYLAGMIADPKVMNEADFEKWMETAYCNMMSDWVVAVTLAETEFAQAVAGRWIAGGKDLYMSAGWSCYCWLLGVRADSAFDRDKLCGMLEQVERSIHTQPDRTRYAMNDFVIALGVSHLPLHAEAVRAAERIGSVQVDMGRTSCSIPLATDYIQRAADKGRLGFKRRSVRC